MGKMFMANLYASLDSTWKSRFSQISKIPGGVYSTTFDPELRIEVKNFPMLGGLWQICMHHWTVHEKVDFLKFPRYRGGVYSTTFDPELRIEIKIFLCWLGGLFHNFWSWTQNWSKKFSYVGWGGGYSTTFDPELRNERFTLISFIGFPAILSTVQPFEIFIFNRT